MTRSTIVSLATSISPLTSIRNPGCSARVTLSLSSQASARTMKGLSKIGFSWTPGNASLKTWSALFGGAGFGVLLAAGGGGAGRVRGFGWTGMGAGLTDLSSRKSQR